MIDRHVLMMTVLSVLLVENPPPLYLLVPAEILCSIARTAFLTGPWMVRKVIPMVWWNVQVTPVDATGLLVEMRFLVMLCRTREATMLEPLWVFTRELRATVLVTVLTLVLVGRVESLPAIEVSASDTPALALLLGMGKIPSPPTLLVPLEIVVVVTGK